MDELKFRNLRADEISPRIGQVGEGWATLLLYKTSRVDVDILNETFGKNWQVDYKEIKGNLYAGISVWNDNNLQWITRWSCGTESNVEAAKGEDSDAFKRSAFRWGIGLALYSTPTIFIRANDHYIVDSKGRPSYKNHFEVTKIEYGSDGKICLLEIYNTKLRKLVFSWKNEEALLAKSQEVRNKLTQQNG